MGNMSDKMPQLCIKEGESLRKRLLSVKTMVTCVDTAYAASDTLYMLLDGGRDCCVLSTVMYCNFLVHSLYKLQAVNFVCMTAMLQAN